jgi:hypothetical protein
MISSVRVRTRGARCSDADGTGALRGTGAPGRPAKMESGRNKHIQTYSGFSSVNEMQPGVCLHSRMQNRRLQCVPPELTLDPAVVTATLDLEVSVHALIRVQHVKSNVSDRIINGMSSAGSAHQQRAMQWDNGEHGECSVAHPIRVP